MGKKLSQTPIFCFLLSPSSRPRDRSCSPGCMQPTHPAHAQLGSPFRLAQHNISTESLLSTGPRLLCFLLFGHMFPCKNTVLIMSSSLETSLYVTHAPPKPPVRHSPGHLPGEAENLHTGAQSTLFVVATMSLSRWVGKHTGVHPTECFQLRKEMRRQV